ncbi:MAG TPA: GatB/YqeY domain-containing protein [Usitatibacter sp.]|nr:GatB/YqeY domain-containing protein [Usitatibacter sp.]
MALREQLNEDIKSAMKAREADRLAALRLMLSAVKQREVDERVTLDDAGVISVVEKMIKQRKDSIAQYEKAARQDLADREKYEISVIEAYLPQQLSPAEIDAIVAEAIAATGAKSAADMGKVMGVVKPKLAGRADMGRVSGLVKAKLAG